MENGLSNSSKRSLKISLRSPKRNLKKNPAYEYNVFANDVLIEYLRSRKIYSFLNAKNASVLLHCENSFINLSV